MWGRDISSRDGRARVVSAACLETSEPRIFHLATRYVNTSRSAFHCLIEMILSLFVQ